MKYHIRTFIQVLIVAATGCAKAHDMGHDQDHSLKETSGHHHHGDRVGLHGMTIFGSGPYYMSHIPTFDRPHNEQLIMRVGLRDADGTDIDIDLGSAGHSVRPLATFSLDDLANQESVTFEANIHLGNFEHNGAVRLPGVSILIEKVLVARNLPGIASTDEGMQKYLVFGSAEETWAVNYITSQAAFQQILKITGTVPGLSPNRVTEFTVESNNRLQPQAESFQAEIPRAGNAPGTLVEFSVQNELWCLIGPDFFQVCR